MTSPALGDGRRSFPRPLNPSFSPFIRNLLWHKTIWDKRERERFLFFNTQFYGTSILYVAEQKVSNKMGRVPRYKRKREREERLDLLSSRFTVRELNISRKIASYIRHRSMTTSKSYFNKLSILKSHFAQVCKSMYISK